jgi:hypothetical protein
MSILQIAMTAPLMSGGAPTYTLTPPALNVDEGSSLTFTVGGTNISDGTYYWTIETNAGDVTESSGSFAITGNSGTFSVTPYEDSTTEGVETFIVYLRSGSITGSVLASETITINDTSVTIGGTLSINGQTRDWSTTNATAPTYAAYTYPDNSSGSVHTLTGTQYVLSEGWSSLTNISVNLWFYPTANNTIIIDELGQPQENGGYHYTMLEINSSNKLKGRVWEMTAMQAVTSIGSATLNSWNHVYFFFNSATNTFSMSLNNETPVTTTSVSRNIPFFSYWGIGLTDSTNMGSSARYQGKFDALVIDSNLAAGSNFDATKAKYNRVTLTSGTALSFSGVDNQRVVISDNQSDWDLGDTWTIEWWQKVIEGSEGFLSILSLDSNVAPYAGIDIFINNGSIQMANGNFNFSEAAATRGQWNHIAIQKNGTDPVPAAYINGVAQSVSGSFNRTIISSSPLNLVIGSRTPDGGATFYEQYFHGQLANIRISNISRYTGTFTPPLTVVTDAYTLLSIDGSSGGDGMLTDETARHTLTNIGAVEDSIG